MTNATEFVQPKFRYLEQGLPGPKTRQEHGFRKIIHAGRTGLNAESIYSRLTLREHTLNCKEGSLTFWCMPLEDMGCEACPVHMPDFEKNIHNFVLLTDDCIEPHDVSEASFAMVYRFDWNDQLFAKFYKGPTGRHALYPQHAITVGGQVPLEKNRWYQIGLTWDREKGIYQIYLNGILISRSTLFQEKLHDPCGSELYLGTPMFAFSSLYFYDSFFSAEDFVQRFESECTEQDEALQESLRHIHEGKGLMPFSWMPDDSWTKRVELAMNREEDLEYFYIQGCKDAANITPEGLLISTHMERTPSAIPVTFRDYDPDQVYFWMKEWLEGDVAVEYEFMPLKENALSLLMIQASGMHREDFMKDYPLRTTGSMRMVHGENVRNYHWEYFREMDDVRHDINSNILVKNPWGYPLAYQCLPERLEKGKWHKIQLVQENWRLRGTMDGRLVFDVYDSPATNTGPVLNCGHIALRCMWKTRLLVRNIKVYSRPPYRTEHL